MYHKINIIQTAPGPAPMSFAPLDWTCNSFRSQDGKSRTSMRCNLASTKHKWTEPTEPHCAIEKTLKLHVWQTCAGEQWQVARELILPVILQVVCAFVTTCMSYCELCPQNIHLKTFILPFLGEVTCYLHVHV